MARKRNIQVLFYLSESENETFIDRLSLANSSRPASKSSYIRKCILEKEITVIPGLRGVNRNLIDVIDELNTINRKIIDGDVKDVGNYLEKINDTILNIYEDLIKISRKIL